MKIKSAWYMNQLPYHMVIVKPDGSAWMASVLCIKKLTDADLQPLPAFYARALGEGRIDNRVAQEVMDGVCKAYGLEKVQDGGADGSGTNISEETLNAMFEDMQAYCAQNPEASPRQIWEAVKQAEEKHLGKALNVPEPDWDNPISVEELDAMLPDKD